MKFNNSVHTFQTKKHTEFIRKIICYLKIISLKGKKIKLKRNNERREKGKRNRKAKNDKKGINFRTQKH